MMMLSMSAAAAVGAATCRWPHPSVLAQQRAARTERSLLAGVVLDVVEAVTVLNLVDFSAVPDDQPEVVLLLSLLPRSQYQRPLFGNLLLLHLTLLFLRLVLTLP